MNWLDRFAAKHPRFGVPNLMKYLLTGSVIVFLLDLFSSGAASELLAFNPLPVLNGEVWRIVTFLFVPDGSSSLWFAVTLLCYYSLGTALEREWGTAKFNLFYLCGAVLTVVAGIILALFGVGYPFDLGPVHSTLFLAYATLYPEAQFRFYFIFPIKAKWLAAIYVVLAAINLLRFSFLSGTMTLLYLLITLPAWANYLLFFWQDLRAAFGYRLGRVKHQTSRKTVNFKRAQHQAAAAAQSRGYTHKCAVCGLTDVDDPTMEFRYCSKCDGYYCYCMNHINSHVHVKNQ